jgi:hypothetical protein
MLAGRAEQIYAAPLALPSHAAEDMLPSCFSPISDPIAMVLVIDEQHQ